MARASALSDAKAALAGGSVASRFRPVTLKLQGWIFWLAVDAAAVLRGCLS